MSWTRTGRRPGTRPAGRSTKLTVLGTAGAAVVLLAVAGYGAADAGTRAGTDAGAAPAAAAAPCLDPEVPPTAEEARLDRPMPGQQTPVGTEIVRRGGLGARVDAFAAALCDVTDATAAGDAVDRYGRSLWQDAVARAQGSDPGGEALPAGDDRPLYWTRLAMTRVLRQWKPGFAADDATRAAWQRRFEFASRGLTTENFTAQAGTRRLFVSGFDPFLLDTDFEADQDIRHSNPSGAVALRLDGQVLTVGGTRVQVQAVVLPVRFQDFDEGIVEAAFRPHVAAGEQHADLLTTISQGEPDRFHLEAYNARNRSSLVSDNVGAQGGGSRPRPFEPPGMGPGPQFTGSSLPLEQMRAAGDGGRYPVEIRTRVMELLPPSGGQRFGTVEEVPGGPSNRPGWVSVEGGGGGFLSNESAYRVTRLVSEAGTPQPAGHLHTPQPVFAEGQTTEIDDASLAASRTAIVEETVRILSAGIAAAG